MATIDCNADILTGRNGKVIACGETIARITQWELTLSLSTSTEWGDSDTSGYTNRAPGRRDATFSFEGKYSVANSQLGIFEPGDCCKVELFLDDDNKWVFPNAMCIDFGVSVNIDTEEIIGFTSSWGANGSWTGPA